MESKKEGICSCVVYGAKSNIKTGSIPSFISTSCITDSSSYSTINHTNISDSCITNSFINSSIGPVTRSSKVSPRAGNYSCRPECTECAEYCSSDGYRGCGCNRVCSCQGVCTCDRECTEFVTFNANNCNGYCNEEVANLVN